jgi:Tol biopolymer transport system component
MRLSLTIFGFLVTSFIVDTARTAQSPTAVLVSRASMESQTGSGASFQPVISADRSKIVFVSQAKNLVSNAGHNVSLDIYVWNALDGNVELVSVDVSGMQGGNDDSGYPSISADGRYVVFASKAGNLVNGDTNRVSDVFVRDLHSGTTLAVSADLTSVTTGDLDSTGPVMTPDGRWIAFESAASNLTPHDTNGIVDVFLHDREHGQTTLLSLGALGTSSNLAEKSFAPSIAADGSRVAFVSTAAGLVAGVSNHLGEVYTWDRASGTVLWVSSDAASFFPGEEGSVRAFDAVISADGQWVVFKAMASNQERILLLGRDLSAVHSTLIESNVAWNACPSLSSDGRYVAYETATDVFVWDRVHGSRQLISVALNGSDAGNGPSQNPVLTPEGTRVAFLSRATDLVTNQTYGRLQVYWKDLTATTTRLVSAGGAGEGGDTDAEGVLPAISTDGSWVAFDNPSDNLTPNDLNRTSDVFVHDLESRETILISRRRPSQPSQAGLAINTLAPNATSTDGRFVAFAGFDNIYEPGDTNAFQDVFVRDLWNGTTIAASKTPDGGFQNEIISGDPVMSRDGRFVFYDQRPYQFSVTAPPETVSIFRYALESRTSEKIAQASTSTWHGYGQGNFRYPMSVNSDGSQLAYVSQTNGIDQIWLKDLGSGQVSLISANTNGEPANGHSSKPEFTPDGHYVIFWSLAQDLTPSGPPKRDFSQPFLYRFDCHSHEISLFLVGEPRYYYAKVPSSWAINDRGDTMAVEFNRILPPGGVYLYYLSNSSSVFLCTNGHWPQLSGDAKRIVYNVWSSLTILSNKVEMLDLTAGTTNVISVNRWGEESLIGRSTRPRITYDGRYVAFTSTASDLVENDSNGTWDVFVRDTLLNTTFLASVNYQGTDSGNGPSTNPILAADGRTILFESLASDLSENDDNQLRDIYLLRLGSADSDGDGLDDDWELTYFNTLERDGTGDFDRDGHTDAQEFQAGTNPANDESILRVLTLSRAGGEDTTIIWSAVPGKTYRVQYKTSVAEASWMNLEGDVVAAGSTGTKVDSGAGHAHGRFYRVVLIQP